MKYLYCLLFVWLVFACKPATSPTWQTIDYGPFKLKAPLEWKRVEFKGIDSYVGGLSNGKDTLSFDYGRYSPHVDLDSSGIYQEDIINGLPALIGISGDQYNKKAAVEIYLRNKQYRFFMSGFNLNDVPAVLQIFKSIYFPYSDTSMNPPLVMTKFKAGPILTGKQLFQMNCASCHLVMKKMIGPPMIEICSYRDDDWIYQFLTNRALVTPDSLTRAYRKEAGDIQCVRFPELTRMEINRILVYAR
ncbi:cytochrome c [Chitinophaga sp.]|uniref:c-type cytochrome n=1 Tax=Chitinophaga sp. TaxID=1869181 RepID=UPI0031D3D022